jgi:PTS system nitrogen regulatory IIA component
MRLNQIFHIEFLNESLRSETKIRALEELIDVLIQNGKTIDPVKTLDILIQREKLGSTGIGDGVAIPHGKISDLDEMVMAFGRSIKGIAFDAVDGKTVKLCFLLLAPENSTAQHLKVLAQISKMVKTPGFRRKLMEAKTKEALYNAIIEQDGFKSGQDNETPSFGAACQRSPL